MKKMALILGCLITCFSLSGCDHDADVKIKARDDKPTKVTVYTDHDHDHYDDYDVDIKYKDNGKNKHYKKRVRGRYDTIICNGVKREVFSTEDGWHFDIKTGERLFPDSVKINAKVGGNGKDHVKIKTK